MTPRRRCPRRCPRRAGGSGRRQAPRRPARRRAASYPGPARRRPPSARGRRAEGRGAASASFSAWIRTTGGSWADNVTPGGRDLSRTLTLALSRRRERGPDLFLPLPSSGEGRGEGPEIDPRVLRWYGEEMRRFGVLVMLACAGACGGGGGGEKAPVFTPVSATTDGTIYTLKLGDLKMVIDGAHGARITEFSLFGKNALVTSAENVNYGSTFWPSPQSSWCAGGVDCWPPPDAIDSGLYNGQIDSRDMSIAFSSDGLASFTNISGGGSLSAVKIFTPNPSSGAIEITYVLTNSTSSATELTFSPWQVSRVAAGGLTFFAPGGGPVTYAPNTASTFMLNEA